MDNVYNELYVVQLAYEQAFVDQNGVKTRQTVVRQMATPPMASPPFSVNRKLILFWGFSWAHHGNASAIMILNFFFFRNCT